MKTTITIVSMLSAIIILTVIVMTFFKDNPEVSFTKDTASYNYNNSSKSNLLDGVDFELYIVTSEMNIWGELSKLKTTEASEVPAVTDEDGNVLAGPAAGDEQAAVTEVPDENAE